MNNRLPNIKPKIKISIICEGPEEYDYMENLLNKLFFVKSILYQWRKMKDVFITSTALCGL